MIPYGKHHIDEDDIQAVVSVLRGGALTQGPVIELFEQTVANYVGAKYAVAVSSGTAALHLAALAAIAGEYIGFAPRFSGDRRCHHGSLGYAETCPW